MSQCAQVVYYLSRAGKLEPPHMIEVPISSPDGLRLADVKQRLTALRGNAMPNMFSWSYKRLYKSTQIWQDVSDEDSLTPDQSGEYVLKGSEYLEKSQGITYSVLEETMQAGCYTYETGPVVGAAGSGLVVGAPGYGRYYTHYELPVGTCDKAAATETLKLQEFKLPEPEKVKAAAKKMYDSAKQRSDIAKQVMKNRKRRLDDAGTSAGLETLEREYSISEAKQLGITETDADYEDTIATCRHCLRSSFFSELGL